MEHTNIFHARKQLLPPQDNESGYRNMSASILSTIFFIICAGIFFHRGSTVHGLLYNLADLASRILNVYAPRPLLNFVIILRRSLHIPGYGSSRLNPLPSMSKFLLGSNVSTGVPAGLGNFDNSCYQNSILQGLSSLPSVRRFFSNMTVEFDTLGPDSMVGTLADLLDTLSDPKTNEKTLWTPQKLKTMDSVNPQDAHEYFGSMMDVTEKELAEAMHARPQSAGLKELDGSTAETPLGTQVMEGFASGQYRREEGIARYGNPLDGLLADRTMCTECGYCEGLRLVSFNCLMTQFPKNFPQWYTFQLGDLLREYMKLEKVGPTYCARCTLLQNKKSLERLLATCATNGLSSSAEFENTARARLDSVRDLLESEDFGENDKNLTIKCGISKNKWTETLKTKQSVIARAPQSLAIHINRSEFDEKTWQLRKNTSPVEFPVFQDMSAWTLGGLEAESKDSQDAVQLWKMDPMQSMLPEEEVTRKALGWQLQYELRAVVRHQGFGHHNGHYVCYKKHASSLESTGKSDANDHVDVSPEDKPEETTDHQSGRWWSFSDEDVRPQDERAVLKAPGVFMLFYERRMVDPPRSTSCRQEVSDTPRQAVPHTTDTTQDLVEPLKVTQEGHKQNAETPTGRLAQLTDDLMRDLKAAKGTSESQKDHESAVPEKPMAPLAKLPLTSDTPSEILSGPPDSTPPTPISSASKSDQIQPTEGTYSPDKESKSVHMRTAGHPSMHRGRGESLLMVAPT
ncbi:cysteine proteinase [Pseudovirgaria hyperparasitica]|uniref:ubiquitinyl hydrolase 1 n=1 Tax=Pseudovirgaria hyperparasitica TaxID=470096 RepID=A0A6A6WKG2_9PEZI|nr:cysteine proteinase [Pseudovirgaria hyperparasitica]KAF2762680.1 cysteine proteinase [Pseudovirgaria hyperparasitica]